jgi:YYY domain-containing protein
MAAFRWWAVLMVLGAAALPLTYTFLGRLPDRGYAFTKMLGVLIASYLFWLLGSFGFLGNNLGGILLAVAGLIALSLWLYTRSTLDAPRSTLFAWLRANGRYVLITELVFALMFALWVWVRAQNPAISATEKPMEFAFLNAVGRSPSFPPLDPWLSGFAISYYYFGYVMTSLIARLAAVPEPIAFNLGIAWLVAGSAVGAFGLVYNLIANQDKETRRQGDGESHSSLSPHPPGLAGVSLSSWNRRAVLFGLIAALALPIAGNMEILLEVLHSYDITATDFWQQQQIDETTTERWQSVQARAWHWLDVRDLNGPPGGSPRYNDPGWWWWRSSRVIHEYHLTGASEEGLEPIAEFPGFSFILGDMHPHVLALPFAFLSLAVAFSWWLRPVAISAEEWDSSSLTNAFTLLLRPVGLVNGLLTAVVLGGLSFLNTWDVLIHLFVVVAAFVLGQWRANGRWHSRFLLQGGMLGFVLAVAAVLLYFPFYLGFRSQAGAPFLLPMLMRPTRLTHFLVIFAMPLWAIFFLLLGSLWQKQGRGWRTGLAVFAGLIGGLSMLMLLLGWVVASSTEGAGRVTTLATDLNLTLPAPPAAGLTDRLGWGLSAVAALLPTILSARLTWPGVTLLLAAVIALVAVAWVQRLEQPAGEKTTWPESLPFVLLLVATGALLTLGPEFVYIRDNFGVRLNTVFKFYYQAWVLFGVAALFGLDYILRRNKAAGGLAITGYLLMLAVAFLFPIKGVASRAAEFRGPADSADRQPPTLDGLAQVNQYNSSEYEALMWLRQNVAGAPVVLEAVGGSYSPVGHGRVSANTGLPTILGWPGHEYQWRGTTSEPAEREPIIKQIYNETDLTQVAPLLNRYGVEYIYIGQLEQSEYNPAGLEKFGQQLQVAFSNGGVTIYRWQPQ